MNSLPILDEIKVSQYDFDDHRFHTHAQQRGLGPAGIIPDSQRSADITPRVLIIPGDQILTLVS
ncbi:hypothetical protein DER44DRAFT_774985 [Fusarium oxysporum]|nr:hypothetical protein DER44DRAFT_774985 [Fusarium oxysporum]